jgi:hypothetical protein
MRWAFRRPQTPKRAGTERLAYRQVRRPAPERQRSLDEWRAEYVEIDVFGHGIVHATTKRRGRLQGMLEARTSINKFDEF